MSQSEFKLKIENLKTFFFLDEGILKAVNNVDIILYPGESIGIIGESGCGKTITVQSILNLIQDPGMIVEGKIIYNQSNNNQIDLAGIDKNSLEMRKIRGNEISFIFQEPMTSLSPVHTIGSQILEKIKLHQEKNKKLAKQKALEKLELVGFSNPQQIFESYAFNLSGGMRQRAMIAMALSCDPSILIADEPTTALDVTIQAQILDLIENIKKEFNTSIIYITHDLGVIAEAVERIYVMYMGKVVESGSVKDIFSSPLHPYTKSLLKSIPRIDLEIDKLETIEGNVPIPLNPPWHCGFYNRCPEAIGGKCDKYLPILSNIKQQQVRCFLYSENREEKDEWEKFIE